MALNYYHLLGIPYDAEQQQIKTVYRSMAKRFHPDTNQGSEAAAELFRQVNEAYRVLSDEKARLEYDRKLNLPPRKPKAPREEKKDQRAPRPSAPHDKAAAGESQQKFNRFMNSLLDAMFGPLEEPQPVAPSPPPQPPPAQSVKPGKPAFNFYYHLAMEKDESSYTRGEDGIIRKNKPADKNKKRSPNSRCVL